MYKKGAFAFEMYGSFFRVWDTPNRQIGICLQKIYLFFFNFASGYAINGLFFDDDSMHKIYQQKGEFNFIQQIPQILYSNIIGYFFDIILSYLSLLYLLQICLLLDLYNYLV